MNSHEREAREAGRQRAIDEFKERVAQEEYERTLKELEKDPKSNPDPTGVFAHGQPLHDRSADYARGRRFWDEVKVDLGERRDLFDENRLFTVCVARATRVGGVRPNTGEARCIEELRSLEGRTLTSNELMQVTGEVRGLDLNDKRQRSLAMSAAANLWAYGYVQHHRL